MLVGDPAPPPQRGRAPNFRSISIEAKQLHGSRHHLVWTVEVGLGPDDIVLDGDPAPPHQKGGKAPSTIFGSCLLWPNGWMDQDDTWHEGGAWSRPHCARWGPSSPPQNQKKGQSPQFSANFYCGQTAGWMKMPLGMEVDLGPGHNVKQLNNGDITFTSLS